MTEPRDPAPLADAHVAGAYTDVDRARRVVEPPKRVVAPQRSPFERDRARVVHAASTRRLAAKTQVMGPQSDDFVRNRLTHSLEVAQVARDLARALGCHPDIAETAALAHDLGHPPFGHNGETVLAEAAQACGGFEGNAQTLRLLTRLEAKTFDADGASVGLNLTRATLDACTKYPWRRADAPAPRGVHGDGSPRLVVKFGVYEDDVPAFDWFREPVAGERRCVEAQVMDLADDVAYSVHDVEDGVVAGRIDLTDLDAHLPALWTTVREWYAPEASDDELADVLAGLRSVGSWPSAPYDGTRRSLAALKNLTSDLVGRFCGAVQGATLGALGDEVPVRHHGDLVVPARTALEITVLKGVAAHLVMRADDRIALMERQRQLLAELVAELTRRGPDGLDPSFAEDWSAAGDDAARLRVVVDQVASLTDASAYALWERLCSRVPRAVPGA
ncbi:deoxyguanosinetriphosphate triphosphohydrolase [Nocardioides zeae]|uniref:Deoxyguanosinetriphosphate triphosphohydrolase-like protein n=1 Tax=Nocardioides imazamoxiresistens TaxID=3231893 RepID=A0ABU3Q1N5_9ACTN|nr:deoxyguanosinetriphosphate triphosphohydrolase [Nocardioides zeae]MDT9595249.1 deoxyguanosinetriphosphate triphosphohydrolase [Nocardioides zeae]